MNTETSHIRMDKEFLSDPHTPLRRLRAEAPVHYIESPDGAPRFLVTRYSDVVAGFSNPSLSSELHQGLDSGIDAGAQVALRANPILQLSMLNQDGPGHLRLRRIAAPYFTKRRVEALTDFLTHTAEVLAAELSTHEQFDVVAEYASIIPVAVICHLFGVPDTERVRWTEGVARLIATFSGDDASESSAKKKAVDVGNDLLAEFMHEMNLLIEAKRKSPDDDYLSALVAATYEAEELSVLELFAMVGTLLAAGSTTTIKTISSGMALFLHHPSQRQYVDADPTLLASAVEEILRFEPPLPPGTVRYAVEDTNVADTVIPKGSYVMLSSMSANRDPAVFENAETFDIARSPNQHLTFGYGPHFCLGAHLGRLEARIGLGALLKAMPDLRLEKPEEPLAWRPVLQRGLDHLRVVPGSH